MGNGPLNGFRYYFSDFLDRLLSRQTLVRFCIPLCVFVVAVLFYPLLKKLYNISDPTFLTFALACGGVVSLLLISGFDKLGLLKKSNLETIIIVPGEEIVSLPEIVERLA